eukprot:4781928-Prymnesium_polylepis.1
MRADGRILRPTWRVLCPEDVRARHKTRFGKCAPRGGGAGSEYTLIARVTDADACEIGNKSVHCGMNHDGQSGEANVSSRTSDVSGDWHRNCAWARFGMCNFTCELLLNDVTDLEADDCGRVRKFALDVLRELGRSPCLERGVPAGGRDGAGAAG